MIRTDKETFMKEGHIVYRTTLAANGAFLICFSVFFAILGYYLINTLLDKRVQLPFSQEYVYVLPDEFFLWLSILVVLAVFTVLAVGAMYLYYLIGTRLADYRHVDRRTVAIARHHSSMYVAEIYSEKICPNCDSTLYENKRFCPNCGFDLKAGPGQAGLGRSD